MSDSILEFAQSYHSTYRAKFHDNANKLFDSLVTASGINVAENRTTAKNYRLAQKNVESLSKRVSKLKTGRVFAILGIVLGFLAILICFITKTSREQNYGQSGFTSTEIIVMAVGLLLIVGMILLIVLSINKKLAHFNDLLNEKRAYANDLYAQCMMQLADLHAQFKISHTHQLCQETLPEIVLDKNFSLKRFDQLQKLYGLQENLAENESTIGIFSGEIFGNPFVEERRFIQSMGTHTYTGSLTISWTTVGFDSKGRPRTQRHTQTLYANVTKPKPYYHSKTYLIFGSEAAPDLSFTHEPTHAERWSERELQRKVRKGGKQIEKMAEEALRKGGTFTEFANTEFDVLFNGTDRDHEVQFRLMFTPLAQKNLLFLMKNPDPYGDDFYFAKRKKLNYISSEHGQAWNFDPSVQRYCLYDVDLCREQFLLYNNSFFCNLVFELAPIMAIPLYQQTKSQDYIYQNTNRRNYTSYEAEVLVNSLDKGRIVPDDCKTDVILKTKMLQKNGNVDKLGVTAHGFTTVEHVEFVSTLGGDGFYHNVPVHWLEYVPVQRECVVEMQEQEETLVKHNMAYKHGLLARLLNL